MLAPPPFPPASVDASLDASPPHPRPAGRSEPAFRYDILGEVIKAGATTLNIPDTTGWNLPHEFQVGGCLPGFLLRPLPLLWWAGGGAGRVE